MEHFFEKVEGWFTFPKLYTEMVNRFPSGSTFVEVGVWKGRSVAYMAVEIINSQKDIKFHAVDPFEFSEEYGGEPLMQVTDAMYNHFMENLAPVKDNIIVQRYYSADAADLFEDESLEFVFIDAAHDYENKVRDILAWLPKLKKNGVLAGHDVDREIIRKAVSDTIGFFDQRDDELIWVVEKKDVIEPVHSDFSAFKPKEYIHFIPYVNAPELLEKALLSSASVAAGDLGIVIDNRNDMFQPSPQAIINRLKLNDRFKVYCPDVPLTTAQTMNLIKSMATKLRCKFFTWMHSDGEITAGDGLNLVEEARKRNASGENWGVLFTHYDVFCAFNVEALKKTGDWDWLRFPYYHLDVDYYHRLRVAGFPCIDYPYHQYITVVHNNDASNTRKNDDVRGAVVDAMNLSADKLLKDKYDGVDISK
jgi:hypothetical protein